MELSFRRLLDLLVFHACFTVTGLPGTGLVIAPRRWFEGFWQSIARAG